MTRTKIILTSDAHIGGKRSSPTWFQNDYATSWRDLLLHVARDEQVKELVFVGDLFEQWLYPVDVIPETMSEILAKWQTLPDGVSLVDALKQCVAVLPDVYYLRGNHDMGVGGNDLSCLSSGGDPIKCITPGQFADLHPGLHAEHGHRGDMFNASYSDTPDCIGCYPLGFFMTRLYASISEAKAETARRALLAALESFVRPRWQERSLVGGALVELVIGALQVYALVNGQPVTDDTRIRFAEPELDEKKITVGDVKRSYHNLLDHALARGWDDAIASAFASVLDNGLDWYARQLLKEKVSPKILVMGHTHHAEAERPYLFCRGIYANCGSWCAPRGHPLPTFVEIDRRDGTARVAVYHWDESAGAPAEQPDVSLSIKL